jgi:succinate dehydrogenase / fumarate reductase cytochrome b subunit
MSASIPASATSGNILLPLSRWIFSSVGKKTIVAVTGILLIAFLFVHLAGNFTLFIGQDALNTYAEKLQSLGPLLWAARLGLLAIFGAHILFTVLLILENRKASGSKYVYKSNIGSSVFARTMKYTGLVVIAFVIFHLAHLTLGLVMPEAYALKQIMPDGQARHDVYSMVILGFQNVPISLFYIAALTLLAFHLSHGIGSLFQTLGIANRKLRPVFEKGGMLIAWLLWLGYVSLPLSVLLGLVKLPANVSL